MDDFEGKSGHFVRKSQMVAGAVLVGCLCLMVGLMCGLLPEAEVCEAPEVGEALVNDAPAVADSNNPPAKGDPVGPVTTTDPEWYELRLPPTVKPTHYKLLLHPNLTTNYFTGEVSISITVSEPVKHPRLHIKAMDIMADSVSITDLDDNVQPIDGYFNYIPNEFLVINMTDMLAPGDYKLNIGFGGWLNQTIVGFYKSVYQDAQGNDRAIATSKFQPTDARRAFPCFDEPAFKANYTTSLVHPSDYIALSNMDTNGDPEEYGDGLMVTNFNPSVPMSTYLACFIVCQFKHKENYTMSGIPFRVYAPEDVLDQVDYSLMIGVNITDYYEEYFDLGYPLPKLDMIAIPDFVSGAMEHWGLITYRETNLLFDEQRSSEGNKERVAAVVAHELAHMWFGNIVTCDWWDDLWLNEGFASYLEYLGVNDVEPDWKMLEVFVTSDLHYVMGIDQIVSSHPIIVDIETPDEINEVFDSIPYSKGASVIRMLNNFLGEDVFRAGVSTFLKDFQYGTAVTDDLWERLRAAAADTGREVDVKRVMDTWTLQMGFPVVTMEKVQEGDDYFLNGTQDWFLVDPNANKSADLYGSPYGDYLWEIPFHYRFKTQNEENREWMWRNESEFSTPWIGGVNDYYVANTNRMGYYRINYDSDTWNLLGEELQTNYTALAEGERAGIIDDSFNLARASRLEYSVPLNMTKYLISETEFVPWDTARDNFLWLGEIMRFEPGYGLYRDYVSGLTSAKYDELGWRDEGTHLETFIRSDIIDLACRHGNAKCLDEAVRLFYDYLNETFISPDLSSDVFQFGMQEVGGQEEWKILFENYQATDVSQERSRLLYGMAQTRIPWILANYLDMLLMDNSPIRSQDFFSVVGYVGDNPVGNPIAWDWARVNWEKIVDKFGIGSRSLGRMIPGLTEFYSTELGLQEMQDFFAAYPEAGAGSRGRQQALERVQGNINWVQRNANVVYEWLQENMV